MLLTAEAYDCYDFTGWSGACSGTSPTCSLAMDENKSVTANFAVKTYSLGINANNGIVSKNPDQSSYNCGATVSLTATPNTGYNFDHWEGDLTGTQNPADVAMSKDMNITAIFVSDSYTISGYVKDGSNTGMSGVAMTFSNSGGTATTTDSSGYYSKTFTAAWTGIVTPSKSGYSFSPATRSYSNITADQINQNYSGGTKPAAFRIWIDKNSNRAYDSGEGVSGASLRVNNETTDRGTTDSEGIISLQNVGNDAKIYAQKDFYSISNPKAVDANFGNVRSRNPYYAGSVNGKMYDFIMASDIMAADGTYFDFPGQNKSLLNAAKDSQSNILVQLVHPKFAWNLVVAFEEAQSADYLDKLKTGFINYADYMYNYTDGYSVVKNVVLIKGAYLNTAQLNYSDVQVRNSEWPNAHVFGNRYNFGQLVFLWAKIGEMLLLMVITGIRPWDMNRGIIFLDFLMNI